ncbi:cell wall binding repeat-containing protein [Clostridium sp. DL-VIII]|uniref:cell wall-binding protein n=1 Tax=Clostridium sp. DL-VIII TaxID=641107 RepID=UPI00023AFB23|nr:cell wall-binding protein [Clostridium sp. DL-VIII]EHI99448.1 cell wall binding repeat-containing protein [Clostridium sp. DL-VIII]
MKKNKLRILTFALIAALAQGTCAYAASSSSSKDDDDYTKEELENLTPGWEKDDINKSNYNVSSYKNSFASTQTDDEDDEEDKKDDTSTTTTTTVADNIGNIIDSTAPSTGNRGDFWGRTKDGKWILIQQGVPATGWQSVRGKWYYMDADGVMQTGWINNGTTWYYLNSDGSMAYNTYVDGYYLGEDGAMI